MKEMRVNNNNKQQTTKKKNAEVAAEWKKGQPNHEAPRFNTRDTQRAAAANGFKQK
jgi:hypothetical protein